MRGNRVRRFQLIERLALAASLVLCATASAEPIDRRNILVKDGDSTKVMGERRTVRLAGFDAPEVRSARPSLRC